MSKLIHTKVNQVNISPHINNYSTRGIIHDTRKISNDPTCGRVKKSILITLLAVMGSCPLSCGILSTANKVNAVGTEVHFGVNVPDVPVLEIILKDGNDEVIDSGTEMDVTPTMAYAGFNTADVNVTVGTSSNGGYNLKMLVDNSSVVSQNNLSNINSNALVSAEGNTIETLGENPETPFTCSAATATTCNFTVNSWGYRLSTDAENTYKAVPETETELLNYTDGATNGVTTSLGFGVRANAKQAGGYYETTLNFIATANPEEITIDSIRYMQDFAALTATEYANVVSSMDTSKTYTLYDSRDREVYTVQKLADGRIWMLDNLRLGSNEPTLLTKANTNIEDDYYVLPASVAEGFTDDASGRTVARINTDSKNVELEYADGKSNKVGTYYNYCAASAGEICEDTYSSAVNAATDICPAGWRLPTGGSSGEFRSLANNLGDVTSGNLTGDAYSTFKTAFHASLSGYFSDNSMYSQGSYGYWWSSTYDDSAYMYYLSLSTSTVSPEFTDNRRRGFSVRCVLKDPVELAITTMQDMATLTENEKTQLLASMPEGKSYTLTDTRDNASESYEIAKLVDGKVWMLENLRLGKDSTIDLTPSDTNIASDFTLPASSTDKFANDSTGYTTAGINTSEKTTVGSGSWKYGVYYNYCAASAGNYCYALASGVDVADTITDSPYDICPAGWRMPTGGPSGEYRALTTALTGTNTDNMTGDNYTTVVNALHLSLSGQFYNGSAKNQGSGGYFWSSTYSNGSNMYRLVLGTSAVYPENVYGSRYIGSSVRCVLK